VVFFGWGALPAAATTRVMVPGAESSWPSLALKVKVSAPEKPDDGV
jgi:hypothetical protein